MAFSLGGIAGTGGNCGCCGGIPCLPCSPCCIPEADLTLSWDGTGSGSLWGAPGSHTLSYNPVGPVWQSAAIPYSGQTITFYFECVGGVTGLSSVLNLAGPYACWWWTAVGTCAVMTGPATCSPYHLQVSSGVSFGKMYVDYP